VSRRVVVLPLTEIRRPLDGTRTNDEAKVKSLMESIAEIGQQVPIDVIEVDGVYYNFSGCHRFEACQRLGLETIKCHVMRGSPDILAMHLK